MRVKPFAQTTRPHTETAGASPERMTSSTPSKGFAEILSARATRSKDLSRQKTRCFMPEMYVSQVSWYRGTRIQANNVREGT